MRRTNFQSRRTVCVRDPNSESLPTESRPDHHSNRLILEHWRRRETGKRKRGVNGSAPRAHPFSWILAPLGTGNHAKKA